MSRFEQEWALVPTAAKVIAAIAPLFPLSLMGFLFLSPPLFESETPHPMLWGFFLLTGLIPSVVLAATILLTGYVWGDAGRRGMNQVGWTLLVLLIPGAIGFILYFILRDPLPLACPSCSAQVAKSHACCTSCGATVRRSCPECGQAVQNGWGHCASCGAALGSATPPPAR